MNIFFLDKDPKIAAQLQCDKHKSIHEIGRGMWMDKNPERDIDVMYKKENYVITIRRMEE